MALWVDDQMAFAASTVAAGNAAIGAWVRMSAWSSAQLADGLVPKAVARGMASPRELAQLVAAGLIVEAGDAYRIVDYLALNPTREQVQAERATRRANAQAAARARWGGREQDASEHASTHADGMRAPMRDACDPHGSTQSPLPIPSHPIPDAPSVISPTEPGQPARSRRKPSTPAPASDATPEDVARWCDRWAIPQNDPAFARFLDHARANDRRQADWSAAWRTWKAREPEFAHANGRHPVQPPGPNGQRAYAIGRQPTVGANGGTR